MLVEPDQAHHPAQARADQARVSRGGELLPIQIPDRGIIPLRPGEPIEQVGHGFNDGLPLNVAFDGPRRDVLNTGEPCHGEMPELKLLQGVEKPFMPVQKERLQPIQHLGIRHRRGRCRGGVCRLGPL